jgi:hypothetical protein
MPKQVNQNEDMKRFYVTIPKDIYDALLRDGKENERTLNQTVRWALKQYVENKNQPRLRYMTAATYPRWTPLYLPKTEPEQIGEPNDQAL